MNTEFKRFLLLVRPVIAIDDFRYRLLKALGVSTSSSSVLKVETVDHGRACIVTILVAAVTCTSFLQELRRVPTVIVDGTCYRLSILSVGIETSVVVPDVMLDPIAGHMHKEALVLLEAIGEDIVVAREVFDRHCSSHSMDCLQIFQIQSAVVDYLEVTHTPLAAQYMQDFTGYLRSILILELKIDLYGSKRFLVNFFDYLKVIVFIRDEKASDELLKKLMQRQEENSHRKYETVEGPDDKEIARRHRQVDLDLVRRSRVSRFDVDIHKVVNEAISGPTVARHLNPSDIAGGKQGCKILMSPKSSYDGDSANRNSARRLVSWVWQSEFEKPNSVDFFRYLQFWVSVARIAGDVLTADREQQLIVEDYLERKSIEKLSAASASVSASRNQSCIRAEQSFSQRHWDWIRLQNIMKQYDVDSIYDVVENTTTTATSPQPAEVTTGSGDRTHLLGIRVHYDDFALLMNDLFNDTDFRIAREWWLCLQAAFERASEQFDPPVHIQTNGFTSRHRHITWSYTLHLLTWLFGLANEKVAAMRRMSAEAVWVPACASAIRGAVRAIVAKAHGRLPAGRKSTYKEPRDDLVLSVVASADDKTNNKPANYIIKSAAKATHRASTAATSAANRGVLDRFDNNDGARDSKK